MAASQARMQILAGPAATQGNSPLFALLPAEVRAHIFAFALTDYPDSSRAYEEKTCYTRPSYFGPRKTDTELLRTCRAVYRECWFLPFLLREQTCWVTVPDRRPPEYRNSGNNGHLRRTLAGIVAQQGAHGVELDRFRVYAQMWKLEAGDLARVLAAPHLHPRHLTLTIRHADWWRWEDDAPLRFEGNWIRDVSRSMPTSVTEFCIEMESLKRKKDQLREIASQMCQRWFFKRRDRTVLYADEDAIETSEWSGTSTWHNKTWSRDESAPGVIDYYIITVPFRPQSVLERKRRPIPQPAREYAEGNYYSKEKLKLHQPE